MEEKNINQLNENEKLVNAYFLGAKRAPRSKEYYILNLMAFTDKRKEYNSAYTLMELFPKMETCPRDVIPPFTKVRCVFEDLEEGAKPRFIRFYNLEEDLKKINITATAVED